MNKANVFTMGRNHADGSNRLVSETIETRNNLGVGWSASLPFIIEDSSSGDLVVTLFFGGGAYELGQDGIKLKNLSRSNILEYDLLDKRVYEDASLSYGDFTLYDFAVLTENYAVADTVFDRSRYGRGD